MLRTFRTAAHWLGRHAFPAAIASVIALGAAGGGIGYAVASGHTTSAPVSSTPAPTSTTPTPKSGPQRHAPATRGAALIDHALALLASQTGQSVASVRSQLQAGKSVDDIAAAKASAIESAILAQIDKLAAHAVSTGKITAAQEATALAMAKTKVEALMAEPGTQLLKDAQKFLQFLHNHAGTHRGAATATPAPAA
ncbi:MAG: hypothetical protein M3R48_09595 [Candidatus Dormibacteraeota bacterium]|nr:hypothetical protein [Candidatus Dormibacteraeota bacterium]